MPPRTGPRRRKRVKPAPAALRYFAVVLSDDNRADDSATTIATTIAHRVELDDGHLVLRDEFDAIFRIFAKGEWREFRPLTKAEIVAVSGPAVVDARPELAKREPEPKPENREQATLTNENDLAIPPEPDKRPVEETDEVAREREQARFIPSSPEEAQRILMELNRRREDSADATPPAPAPRKE